MAKSKIWGKSSDLGQITRPISGLNLGLTIANSLKFGIEILSEVRVGHGIRFRLVGEEGWDQWTGLSGGVDRFLQTVAHWLMGAVARLWEKTRFCGEVKRTHLEGTGRLMVVSRTCAGGVTSRNGYRRQEQWRPWGESGGVGPLSEREDGLGRRRGGGCAPDASLEICGVVVAE